MPPETLPAPAAPSPAAARPPAPTSPDVSAALRPLADLLLRLAARIPSAAKNDNPRP